MELTREFQELESRIAATQAMIAASAETSALRLADSRLNPDERRTARGQRWLDQIARRLGDGSDSKPLLLSELMDHDNNIEARLAGLEAKGAKASEDIRFLANVMEQEIVEGRHQWQHLSALTQRMDTPVRGMDTLTQRMDTLTQRTETVVKGMDSLTQRTETVVKGMDSLTQGTETVVKGMDSLAPWVSTFAKGMETLNHAVNVALEGFSRGREKQDESDERLDRIEALIEATDRQQKINSELVAQTQRQLDHLSANVNRHLTEPGAHAI